jgi:hypothetical protein
MATPLVCVFVAYTLFALNAMTRRLVWRTEGIFAPSLSPVWLTHTGV